MIKNLLKILVVLVVLTLVIGSTSTMTNAATPDEIEASIVSGLAWLAGQQAPGGEWQSDYYCDYVANTGLAVLKFETRAIELGLDPRGGGYAYSAQVIDGLNYIMANAHTIAIAPQSAGDPDGNGNGVGIYFNQSTCDHSHDIYNSGIAMMALAASGHPELYAATLQDAVDYMAWAQSDDDCGLDRGGWRYQPDCSSDNSNTGYVTLGLGFAEAPPPYGFGLTVPQWVKDELSIWIDAIQDPVNGDTDDGGSHYTPGGGWVNILKTGNLIFEMVLVGDTNATPRLQHAVDYLERHWQDPGVDPGWGYSANPAGYQAMFIVKKGLDFAHVPLLDLDGDSTPEHDWFMELVDVIVAQQNADGSWPTCNWGSPTLCTSWALLAIEPFVPPTPTPIDVKPGSCPNPLNVNKKGVLPVAVLGLEGFDVTQIDPASIELFRKGVEGEGSVSPLRWSWEDAGMPYDFGHPELGAYDCLAYYPDEYGVFDGYLDLSLKFSAQEVAGVLGDVEDGDVVILVLTGKLKEEFGGTGFTGQDVILILEKK